MALAIDDRPSLAERAAKLRLIDTDMHNDLTSLNEFHTWLEHGEPAIASAYNDWPREKWVRPYGCFKSSFHALRPTWRHHALP